MSASLLLALLKIDGEIRSKPLVCLNQHLRTGVTDPAVHSVSTRLSNQYVARHPGLVGEATDNAGSKVLRFGCVLAEFCIRHADAHAGLGPHMPAMGYGS